MLINKVSKRVTLKRLKSSRKNNIKQFIKKLEIKLQYKYSKMHQLVAIWLTMVDILKYIKELKKLYNLMIKKN